MKNWSVLYWGQIVCLAAGAGILMPLVWRRAAQQQWAQTPQFAGALVALVALGSWPGAWSSTLPG